MPVARGDKGPAAKRPAAGNQGRRGHILVHRAGERAKFAVPPYIGLDAPSLGGGFLSGEGSMALRSHICGLALGALLGAAPVEPALAQSLDLASAKVIDLSHSFDASTIYWPTSPSGFELKPIHKGL